MTNSQQSDDDPVGISGEGGPTLTINLGDYEAVAFVSVTTNDRVKQCYWDGNTWVCNSISIFPSA